ncbi:hypothetical protein PanWU01x14_299360 [Parasponia andersonii]|uniref:Uncharacterized protein n=1 Tax=Parasponia andersonii TaxID=3476 RepID=A0A2P5AUF9_PARAD|nr:hypothetical protein PanWU01x14_299360 [Parasponia andersonii]
MTSWILRTFGCWWRRRMASTSPMMRGSMAASSFSRLMILMATFELFSSLIMDWASKTLAKLPRPNSRPSRYLPSTVVAGNGGGGGGCGTRASMAHPFFCGRET